jgi:phosphoadenosine phosphosulfate reductase
VNDLEIETAARELEGADPATILGWAAAHFAPKLGFATALDPEGGVLLEAIADGGLDVDVFTLDTGVLFDESYELWRTLEARYGVTIRAVRPELTLAQQGDSYGDALWLRDPDACCRMRKVEPLAAAIEGAKFTAWITAIRREQTPERANAKVVERDRRFGIVKVNPLVAWNRTDLWRRVLEREIPYNPLHDQGYPSIGCRPCTSKVAPGEDPRSGRWRNQGKNECGLHLPVVQP